MKSFVIPDVHLKTKIFDLAKEHCDGCDQIVLLGDFVDDFNHEKDLWLYEETLNGLKDFVNEHRDNTYICWGNHDLSYIWDKIESGYSSLARDLVVRKLNEIKELIPEGHCGYIFRFDNCLFSHGGLLTSFVIDNFGYSGHISIDPIIDHINRFDQERMWKYNSPIWARPQNGSKTYPHDLLQVVGHTPMERITLCENVLSTDVFSTYPDGTPIGTQRFVIIDTVTKEYIEV